MRFCLSSTALLRSSWSFHSNWPYDGVTKYSYCTHVALTHSHVLSSSHSSAVQDTSVELSTLGRKVLLARILSHDNDGLFALFLMAAQIGGMPPSQATGRPEKSADTPDPRTTVSEGASTMRTPRVSMRSFTSSSPIPRTSSKSSSSDMPSFTRGQLRPSGLHTSSVPLSRAPWMCAAAVDLQRQKLERVTEKQHLVEPLTTLQGRVGSSREMLKPVRVSA
mmetsp:Transcript_12346/g.30146  ORF Transcript_12346/g.30146 Transcript_12346/m.30146 type:complete len:221 (+) Transcript_12346:231-893(+)